MEKTDTKQNERHENHGRKPTSKPKLGISQDRKVRDKELKRDPKPDVEKQAQIGRKCQIKK